MKQKPVKCLTSMFFVLLMTVATLYSAFPFVSAQQSIGRTVQTGAYLAVAPNPVGVNQQVLMTFWVEPSQPVYSVFHGYTVKITRPDGKSETLGPFTSLGQQTLQHASYVPKSVGNYSIQFTYPGEKFSSTNDTYLPSEAVAVTLAVQEQPIGFYPQSPYPTDYWTRPINAEMTNWAVISGNWLFLGYNNTQVGYGDSWGGFNPYTTAPLAAHIMWTLPMNIGGLVGGDDTQSYVSGATYSPWLTPPVIMNGLIYVRTTPSSATTASSRNVGFECVDLRTGQILWTNTNGTIDFGQVFEQTTGVSGQGTRAYVWGNTQTSTWDVFDAYSGKWLYGFANATPTNQWVWWSDAIIEDTNGIIYDYLLDGLHGWLACWNSSRATSSTGRYNNWRTGIQWNVTIPLHLVNSTTTYSTSLTTVGPVRQGISSNVLLAKVTDGSNKVYYEMGYDIYTGQEIWVHGQSESTQGFFTVMGGQTYASWDITTANWNGYNLQTGQKIWTTESLTGWGGFTNYGNVIANGVLYAGTYDGHLRAIDTTSGNKMWDFYAGNAGTATPYGSWPFWGGVIVGGGIVFSGTGQESPTNPLFPGNRLFAVNATTGQSIWNITGYFAVRAIADGYLLAFNSYDNRVYCFGKGPSATTIQAPLVSIPQGSSVTIIGTVTDETPNTKGTPAISDNDMSQWMEYLYMSGPKPTDIKGVNVTLTTLDPNGNIEYIGTTTCDPNGKYGISWAPPVPGLYKIIATFDGSGAYGSSSDTTYLTVSSSIASPNPSPTTPPTTPSTVVTPIPPTPTPSQTPTSAVTPPGSSISTFVYIAIAAIVIIVVIVAAAIILRRRK